MKKDDRDTKPKPTCPLRKPCAFCGKPYGRRTFFSHGYWRLEVVSKWKAGKTCSLKCKDDLSRLRAKQEREQAARDRVRFDAAYTQFVGTPSL